MFYIIISSSFWRAIIILNNEYCYQWIFPISFLSRLNNGNNICSEMMMFKISIEILLKHEFDIYYITLAWFSLSSFVLLVYSISSSNNKFSYFVLLQSLFSSLFIYIFVVAKKSHSTRHQNKKKVRFFYSPLRMWKYYPKKKQRKSKSNDIKLHI